MDKRMESYDLSQLSAVLLNGDIDLTQWHPSAIEALLNELRCAESRLSMLPLQRELAIVRVLLKHHETGKYLIEDSIQHADGRSQERGRALSEKLIGNETPVDCAKRALKEELPIADTANFVVHNVESPRIEIRDSPPSYPGLRSQYEIHDVTGTIAGLPTGPFATRERKGGVLVATHQWSWLRKLPESADRPHPSENHPNCTETSRTKP